MKIAILTAFNEAFREIGDIAAKSMRAYAEPRGYDFRCYTIGPEWERKPSWAKVPLILRNLPDYDYVQWIDADAVVTGEQDLSDILQPATLNIARDLNGINCGVMAWRNCEQSLHALRYIDHCYPRYADHPWFEQAALMSFVDELEVCYQPKPLYNAYAEDFGEGTLIRHWPGQPNDVRLVQMRAVAASRGLVASNIL
jgi:hypothetical protein